MESKRGRERAKCLVIGVANVTRRSEKKVMHKKERIVSEQFSEVAATIIILMPTTQMKTT